MDMSEVSFLKPISILARPTPFDDESWLGYLLRLSAANGYSGLADLGRLLKLTPQSLLMSEPAVTLSALGINFPKHKMPKREKVRMPGVGEKCAVTGRCRHFKVCPQCLAGDKHPYVRSSWDGPISFTCEKHRVMLLSECNHCGKRMSFEQKDLKQCECGAIYMDQMVPTIPPWVDKYSRIFQEAYAVSGEQIFKCSTDIERDAAAITYWLMEPIDEATGRRKPKVKRKDKELSYKDLQRLEPLLWNWPQSAIALVRMEVDATDSTSVTFLRRRLSVAHFDGIWELACAVESQLTREGAIWTESNRETILDPLRDTFTMKDLMRVTDLTHIQLIKLAVEGRIPGIPIGRRRALRPHLVDVPAYAYWSLHQTYRDTSSIAHAATDYGCSRSAMSAVVESGAIRSFSISPELKEKRPFAIELTKFSACLFRCATYSVTFPVQQRIYFNEWAIHPSLKTRSISLVSLLARIQQRRLHLFSDGPNPARLDALYISKWCLQALIDEMVAT